MRKIVWAPSAYEDLKEAHDFIGLDNPEAARQWVGEIMHKVKRLATFPKMGRVIPEIGLSRYRELIMGGYRICHEVTAARLIIFRILHSKRLLPGEL